MSAALPTLTDVQDSINRLGLGAGAAELHGGLGGWLAGGGADGARVYGTVIYGQNAYGDIELDGNGKAVKIIIHAPGHGDDPLEQRGTIAWKVKGFCCTILQDSFIVRIEHGATA